MKSDNGLYKLIYEYFETRLLYGYYACVYIILSIAVLLSAFLALFLLISRYNGTR